MVYQVLPVNWFATNNLTNCICLWKKCTCSANCTMFVLAGQSMENKAVKEESASESIMNRQICLGRRTVCSYSIQQSHKLILRSILLWEGLWSDTRPMDYVDGCSEMHLGITFKVCPHHKPCYVTVTCSRCTLQCKPNCTVTHIYHPCFSTLQCTEYSVVFYIVLNLMKVSAGLILF